MNINPERCSIFRNKIILEYLYLERVIYKEQANVGFVLSLFYATMYFTPGRNQLCILQKIKFIDIGV